MGASAFFVFSTTVFLTAHDAKESKVVIQSDINEYSAGGKLSALLQESVTALQKEDANLSDEEAVALISSAINE